MLRNHSTIQILRTVTDEKTSSSRQVTSDDLIKKDQIIGKGGYAYVYSGTFNHKQVAIKEVANNPSTHDRENNQIRVMIDLTQRNAPHTLPLIAYTSLTPPTTLITPLMSNGSLYSQIHCREKPLTLSLRLRILIEAATALEFLHANLYAHVDIKPDNVLLDDDYHAYLNDFDFTKKLDPLNESFPFNTIPGTVIYMAPELLTQQKYTKAADIYSFTMMAWETLSWREAYSNATCSQDVIRLKRNHVTEPIPEDWSPAIKTLITNGWSANPSTRPTIKEIKSTLEDEMKLKLTTI